MPAPGSPDPIIPPDNLTTQERETLLRGLHALIAQVPTICGYKLKKSKPDSPHYLRDYAYLFSKEDEKEAFIHVYGDTPIPFSIEISDDGQLFRILPHSVYRAEGKDVVVKWAMSLETHPNCLFQANTILARKRVTLPPEDSKIARAIRIKRIKQEANKIPHLLPGYVSTATPIRVSSQHDGDRVSCSIIEKCPAMHIDKRRLKTSLIMPRALGVDLFEWCLYRDDPTLVRSLRERPMVALNSMGYRFRKYTPLIAASLLLAIDNFRLHQADEEWVHRDLKLENIMLHMSDTDPVDITVTLIDAEDIAPASQGLGSVAGTLGYLGKEFYESLLSHTSFIISSKIDSYAVGVVMCLLFFHNFNNLMYRAKQQSDILSFFKNCFSYDRFRFTDEDEQVQYLSRSRLGLIPLRPILPRHSPDYQSLYAKAKAMAPMMHEALDKRPFPIDVLKVAFMPELAYLVQRNPALKNTPVIQTLFDLREDQDNQEMPRAEGASLRCT